MSDLAAQQRRERAVEDACAVRDEEINRIRAELASLEECRAAEERISRDQQRAIDRLQAELDSRGAGTKRAWEAAKGAYAERDRLRDALLLVAEYLDEDSDTGLHYDLVVQRVSAALASKEPTDAG